MSNISRRDFLKGSIAGAAALSLTGLGMGKVEARAEEDTAAEDQHDQHEVEHVDAEALFGEPCADKAARQPAEDDQNAVGAELSAEQFKRRKHTYPQYTKIQPAKG